MWGSRPFKIPLSWREGFRSNARNGSKARLGPRPVIGRYSSPVAAAGPRRQGGDEGADGGQIGLGDGLVVAAGVVVHPADGDVVALDDPRQVALQPRVADADEAQ